VSKGFQAGRAVTTFGLVDDLGAVFPGYFRCAIGGAVVGHHHTMNRGAGDFPEHPRQGGLLVESRDYAGDALHGLGVRRLNGDVITKCEPLIAGRPDTSACLQALGVVFDD
jgi:hypothetical protein